MGSIEMYITLYSNKKNHLSARNQLGYLADTMRLNICGIH